jgi:2-amino-4-hydroxy-6-hydroxymethyldihydropteridine diphosphokinase
MKSQIVFIALGSNIEPRNEYLEKAETLIEQLNGVDEIVKSKIYETKPLGPGSFNYFNQVFKLKTGNCNPSEFLNELIRIENHLGRKRTIKWGDRTIDLDILFWENEIINLPHLKIPHPEIQNRNFVLEPFMDIDPLFIHPVLNKTIEKLYGELNEKY